MMIGRKRIGTPSVPMALDLIFAIALLTSRSCVLLNEKDAELALDASYCRGGVWVDMKKLFSSSAIYRMSLSVELVAPISFKLRHRTFDGFLGSKNFFI